MKLFAAIALIASMALVGCGKSNEDKLNDAIEANKKAAQANVEKAEAAAKAAELPAAK